MGKNLQSLKKLKQLKKSNKALIIGHNALDHKSLLKYPFPYETKRGFHPPAPTSLLYDNWQDFSGDIITCHYQNYDSDFVVTTEPSPRFHASGGVRVSNCPAYNKDSKEAYNGMKEIGLEPEDFNFIDIPKVFAYKEKVINLYSGHFALVFACMMGYKEVYTAGIDGTILGYNGGFASKKKHIKAMKKFVRNGSHKKVGIFKNPKPTNMAEWSDWKVTEGYFDKTNYVLGYCKDMYPNTKIYKSHKLSKLNVEIRNPFTYA